MEEKSYRFLYVVIAVIALGSDKLLSLLKIIALA
jgi:hypothetical protein